MGWKGPENLSSSNALCHWQRHLPLDKVAQGPIHPGLEYFYGWVLFIYKQSFLSQQRSQKKWDFGLLCILRRDNFCTGSFYSFFLPKTQHGADNNHSVLLPVFPKLCFNTHIQQLSFVSITCLKNLLFCPTSVAPYSLAKTCQILLQHRPSNSSTKWAEWITGYL